MAVHPAFAFKHIFLETLVIQFRGRYVQRYDNVFSRLISGLCDGLRDEPQGFLGIRKIRRESAFISHRRTVSLVF